MRDCQDSKRGTLDEMSYSGERELVESASRRRQKCFPSNGGIGLPSHSRKFDPELFLSKRIAETKTEKSLKERSLSDRTKLRSSRPDNTNDNIAYRQEPSMAAFQEAQQAAD